MQTAEQGVSRGRVVACSALVLFAVTLVFFNLYDAYTDTSGTLVPGWEPAPSRALVSPALEDLRAAGWIVNGEGCSIEAGTGPGAAPHVLRIDSDKPRGAAAYFLIEDVARIPYVRVHVHARAETITRGTPPWKSARVLFFVADREGRRHWEIKHQVCDLASGATGWHDYDEVFVVPPFAATGFVYLENIAATGTVWIDRLSVSAARRSPLLAVWRTLFAAAWLGVAVAALRVLHVRRRPLGWAVVLVAALIVGGVVAPEGLLERITGTGRDAFNRAAGLLHAERPAEFRGSVPGPGAKAADKPPVVDHEALSAAGATQLAKSLGHAGLFAALGLLGAASILRMRVAAWPGLAVLTCTIALFAAVTEALQLLTDTRTARVGDWLVDMAGALTGIAVVTLIFVLRRRPAVPEDKPVAT